MIKFAIKLSKFEDFFGKRIIFSQKLKRNSQNSRKKLNIWEDLSSPTLPSGVKKKPALAAAELV